MSKLASKNHLQIHTVIVYITYKLIDYMAYEEN